MRPYVATIFFFFGLMPVDLGADTWISPNNKALFNALAVKTLAYEDAIQRFYSDGNTLYDAGQESWGKWRVEGDKYCSLWPPTDQWDCYFFEMNSRGDRFRFVSKDGSATIGRYVK